MKDPYEKVWDNIGNALTAHRNALTAHSKMVLWIAERVLSVKDFKEFIDEFTKKAENHDELIDFIHKEGR